MRFLIAFSALVAYASASAILAPYTGINAGDAQAAAIDATVAAQDQARAINENHLRSVEQSRDINENAYWNGLAASQNYVAAAQSQAASLSGVAAARAAYLPGIAGPIGYAAPWGVPGIGHRGW